MVLCRISFRRGQQNLSPQYRHIHTEKYCGRERLPAEPDDLQAGRGAGGHDERGCSEYQHRSGVTGTPTGRVRQRGKASEWCIFL